MRLLSQYTEIAPAIMEDAYAKKMQGHSEDVHLLYRKLSLSKHYVCLIKGCKITFFQNIVLKAINHGGSVSILN